MFDKLKCILTEHRYACKNEMKLLDYWPNYLMFSDQAIKY